MFSYYLTLGLRSLRRNPALTALMVLTLAIGVATSMSTFTVLRAMSGDPIPSKSDRLFVVQMENTPKDQAEDDADPPPHQSWLDIREFLEAGDGLRRTAMYAVGGVMEPEGGDGNILVNGMAVGADFFAMFEAPFRHGGPWSAETDARGGSEVVLSATFAQRLFGDADPTGKRIRLFEHEYVVAGVLAPWRPMPKYYWLIGGSNRFSETDDIFIPLRNAIANESGPNGNVNCNGPGPEPGYVGLLNSECLFMQYWVELASAGERGAYRERLAGYIDEQKKLGRLEVGERSRLMDVREWMDFNDVLGDDTILQTLLALGFLLVCMVNTVGLLLAKFTAHAGEIGVRRALGATRRQIFQQYLIQAGVVGAAGGVLGLALTFGGLWLLARQSDEVAAVAHMSPAMLLATVATAVVAALLAGLLPTWRACLVV
ncbi:MAG: ABC transporter permease, partial [Arenimonas sp.]|nr:ABC transporter permease [Arenimonas sp.]